MILGVIFAIAVVLLINYIIAQHGLFAAEKKGYDKSAHAFAMCFWLGAIGFIYVASLPDLVSRRQNEAIINLLKEQSGEK